MSGDEKTNIDGLDRRPPAEARPIHIGFEVHQQLLRQHCSVQWFADQLNCNRTNVYNIFNRESIATQLLMDISRVLDYDFFALYSAELARSKRAGK